MSATNRLLTIPNLLSLSRLALIPAWWWLMSSSDPAHHMWGGVLIVYAIISDVLDGWIARRWNQTSEWGKLFDPIGDKLAALIVGIFCVMHRDMPWPALALTVVRDLALIIGGWVMYRQTHSVPGSVDFGRYAALMWGVVLLLYAFKMQPYARFTLWPVVVVYILAGIVYLRSAIAK